jgi:hypothetical protein
VDAGPQSHEGNVSSTDGAASHLGQLGRNAGCQTPRVGASLWSMHCLEVFLLFLLMNARVLQPPRAYWFQRMFQQMTVMQSTVNSESVL